ncbi:MAG TPA: MFS transporter [Usitatibacteraceae bacterium]|nr:MFS transporter [Usitatibacteraceae bacterium]
MGRTRGGGGPVRAAGRGPEGTARAFHRPPRIPASQAHDLKAETIAGETAAAARLRRILYAAAFLRALAIGMMAVLIGLYCARLGFSAAQIGVVLSAALWGAALATLATMLAGRRFSERSLLLALTGLPVLGCAVLLATDVFAVIAAAAFAGMFNVNGRDRGAIPILEQAMFPATTTDADRTRVFAWYNVLLDSGYAAGGLLAGIPTILESLAGMQTLAAMKATLSLFCVLYLASAVLYARLPARVGDTAPAGLRQLSRESRPIIGKISALFFVDAFAGGFIGSAIFAYWFSERFGASAATVAILFSAGRLLSAASHIVAAWLAKRIGLINTMVYTHIPSSLLLFTIVVADDFAWAAFFFLLRESLNEMDVPTRQSYVMAVVKPEERLAAAGLTNLVRSGGWALAPMFAGTLMQTAGLGVPLVLAGIAKIGYDLALWGEFRRVKPPEER